MRRLVRWYPGDRALLVAALATLAVGWALALVWVPPDRFQGDVQRLMYVHVPAAWNALALFTVAFLASVRVLWKRSLAADRLAHAAVEVGLLFTALTLALGSLWGKPVWGVWWTWDPRLTTTAVLFVLFAGYLALRRATLDPTVRARRAAVFGLLAFAQVPIVHMSVIWWRALHQPPTVLRPGDPTIDHVMLAALLLNVVAFTLVFLVLLRSRMRLAADREALDTARDGAARGLAGEAVTSPDYGKGTTSHV